MINIYSEKEIAKIREASRIVAKAHEEIGKSLRAGMTTKDIDDITERVFRENGANPSCKGYPKGYKNPFPAASCISVNDEVIHGIPGNRVIKDGDLVCVDLVADKDGYFGDATRCYVVGEGSEVAQRLIEVAKESFYEGIKYAKPGNRISDISHAIQEYVEKNGFSVVREYQGHGIGRDMHEDPGVPNYGRSGRGPRLEAGMVIAVEPMINEGSYDIITEPDGWTVLTKDGKLSAHYENTIVITKNGAEILTTL
mgnify:FL=1